MAIEVPGRLIKRDCGTLLEQTKLYNEAARVYEAGEFYDRAAGAYLRAKNWYLYTIISVKSIILG
jgi:WD repeat-containing protein 19